MLSTSHHTVEARLESPGEEFDNENRELPPGVRILLVEDGPDNQRLLSIILKKHKAKVDIAENGLIAIEKVEQSLKENHSYDVILMDMQMPIMDGYDATAKLRSKGCQIPIIALTAHAMTGQREKCLALGCNEFATKPIQRDKLLNTIARSIQSSHASSLS